jgi:acyl-CoA synthetase (AMP-forming)/AMP-acid ligase II
VGEIWVAGASIAQGYWGKEEASERTFRARLPDDTRPWLRTGDLGFLDGPNLYVTGRSKDVIIICGVNHYPQDIEETVERAHAAIRPNFVMAFADQIDGEEVLVLVAELRRGEAEGLDLSSLADPIFRAVAREHEITAREVHFVHHGQVPKTTSGKLQRSHCRALLRAGQLEIHGSFRRGGAR